MAVDETAIRLLIAAASAALIGLEREVKSRPAGLRTHMLVSIGACLATIVALDLGQAYADRYPGSTADPQKVIAGVIGGVGFLGAGAIIQGRGEVRGLTTAAGIWVVAAIGVAAGAGDYAAVAIASGFVLATLYLLAKLEGMAGSRRGTRGRRNDAGDGDGPDAPGD